MDNPSNEQVETPEVPSKIVINGQEYDSAEAESLIGLGRQTREYEQKWNTSLDKVWPEFGRSQQTLKQKETELNEARAQLAQFQQKKEDGTETGLDTQKAKEAARKLGIVLGEDLDSKGYVSKDELEAYLDKREKEREAVKEVLSTADKLEKEIDGSDGRPKFNKRAVLAYAQAYGHNDLKTAYEDMHKDFLTTWQQDEISKNTPSGLKTLKSTPATKEPKQVKVDDNNVGKMLKEALWEKES